MHVPRSVRTIGAWAFQDWKDLKKVIFTEESELEVIGNGAFAGSGLAEFIAPERLKRIGTQAFCRCDSLRYAQLNDQLMTMDFGICQNLYQVRVPAGMLLVAYDVNSNKFQATLVVSRNTRIIEWYPAYEYFGVSEVKFEQYSRVEEIGEMAFWGTKLRNFNAPESICEIGRIAFGNCEELENVQITRNVRKLGDFCFLGTKIRQLQLEQNIPLFPEKLGIEYDRANILIPPRGLVFLDKDQVKDKNIKVVVVPSVSKKLKVKYLKNVANFDTLFFKSIVNQRKQVRGVFRTRALRNLLPRHLSGPSRAEPFTDASN